MKKIEFLAKFGVTVTATLTLSGEAALKRVSYDGDALRYVKDQTADICLKAVEMDGDALQHPRRRSPRHHDPRPIQRWRPLRRHLLSREARRNHELREHRQSTHRQWDQTDQGGLGHSCAYATNQVA